MTIRRAGMDSIQTAEIQESRAAETTETIENRSPDTEANASRDSRAAEFAGSVMSERLLSGYAQKLYVSDLLQKAPDAAANKSPEFKSQSTPVKENGAPEGAASIQKTLRPGSKGA